MRIYQGGAVPGNKLRIVEIKNIDVQACGGTHLDNTIEVKSIIIFKSSKIQDGVVRLNFTAGNAAVKTDKNTDIILKDLAKLLGVKVKQIPGRALELFLKWKIAKKAFKKGIQLDKSELNLISTQEFDGDIILETSKIFNTQPEHLIKVAKRFLDQLKKTQ